jgi:hypothetical protein
MSPLKRPIQQKHLFFSVKEETHVGKKKNETKWYFKKIITKKNIHKHKRKHKSKRKKRDIEIDYNIYR